MSIIKVLFSISLLMTSLLLNAKEYKISGPDVVMEPPAGFTLAERFDGFEQLETFSTIRIKETKVAIKSAIASQFKTNLETLESQNVTISQLEGLLLKNHQILAGTEFEQWTLLFGDALSTVTIVASYPQNMAKAMGPLLKQSLLSTRRVRMTKERLFKDLPFTLEKSGSFSYDQRTLNSIVLRDKAPFDPSTAVTPILVVSHATTKTPIEDKLAFVQQQLAVTHKLVRDIDVIETTEFTIAGVKAHKTIAHAIDLKTTKAVLVYQAIAIQDNRFLLVQGIAPLDQADFFMPQFNTIVDSIAFKKAAK